MWMPNIKCSCYRTTDRLNLRSTVLYLVLLLALPLFTHAGEAGMGGTRFAEQAAAVTIPRQDQGKLQRELARRPKTIYLKLFNVTEFELTELFNRIIETIDGVKAAQRYRMHLEPDRPQACVVEWEIEVADIDAFELESRIFNKLKEFDRKGALVVVDWNFPFEVTNDMLAQLRQISPWQASAAELLFIQYRPRMRPAPDACVYLPECWDETNCYDAGFD